MGSSLIELILIKKKKVWEINMLNCQFWGDPAIIQTDLILLHCKQ